MATMDDTGDCGRGHDVAAYATGEMAASEREAAEAHFVACGDCRRELANFARFVAAADIDPSVDGIDWDEISALAAETLPKARARAREARESRRAHARRNGGDGGE